VATSTALGLRLTPHPTARAQAQRLLRGRLGGAVDTPWRAGVQSRRWGWRAREGPWAQRPRDCSGGWPVARAWRATWAGSWRPARVEGGPASGGPPWGRSAQVLIGAPAARDAPTQAFWAIAVPAEANGLGTGTAIRSPASRPTGPRLRYGEESGQGGAWTSSRNSRARIRPLNASCKRGDTPDPLEPHYGVIACACPEHQDESRIEPSL
jgi:hypothetical protein